MNLKIYVIRDPRTVMLLNARKNAGSIMEVILKVSMAMVRKLSYF